MVIARSLLGILASMKILIENNTTNFPAKMLSKGRLGSNPTPRASILIQDFLENLLGLENFLNRTFRV